jgi:hypothetical protein
MSWADSGIAITVANQNGSHLFRLVVNGLENKSNPAVADTDNMKPKSIDHHGFHINIDNAATANSGKPDPGLPLKREIITTIAITVALRTLGCGVTNTTNAMRARAATTKRVFLPAPHSAARAITLAVTMAQLAPETAVM